MAKTIPFLLIRLSCAENMFADLTCQAKGPTAKVPHVIILLSNVGMSNVPHMYVKPPNNQMFIWLFGQWVF
jgi:hypothetical protein